MEAPCGNPARHYIYSMFCCRLALTATTEAPCANPAGIVLYSMFCCKLAGTATTEAPCVNPARIVQNVLLQAGRHNYYRGTACQSCWALYSMFCSCRLAGPARELYSMFCCRLAGTATTEALSANPAGHSSEDLFRAGATPTSHAGISRTAHWTTGIVVSYSTQRTAVHSVHCTATVYSCV